MNDRCANCDRELEPWAGEPSDRPPCPDCGGTARIIQLHTGGVIQASGEATIRVVARGTGTVHWPGVPPALQGAIAELDSDHARLFLVTDLGGGTFHAEVRDERGQVLGQGVGDNLDDALLELADHLTERGTESDGQP